MLNVFDKNGNGKNLVEDSDILNFKRSKNIGSLPFNGIGEHVNIKVDMGASDKATIFVFGNHNGAIFAAIIQSSKGNTNPRIENLIGDLGINIVTNDGNAQTLQINSAIYGCFGAIATCEIVDVYGSA